MSHIDVDMPLSLALAEYNACEHCGVGTHSTWQHELGQVVATTDRAKIVHAGITVLAKANERAKAVAAQAVERSTLLSRSTTREWANTFTSTVEGMVVRLLSVGKDGVYAWEKNPQLLKVIPDYIESEAKDMVGMQAELLGIAAGIRQAIQAIAEQSVALILAAVDGAMKGFPPTKSSGIVVVIGVSAALLAAAYVWRSFR